MMSKIYHGEQYDGQEVYVTQGAETVSGAAWERDAEAEGRPAAPGSTAVLDEAIRKSFAENAAYQDEHGSSDHRSGRLLGQLEGLQMAKALIQQQP